MHYIDTYRFFKSIFLIVFLALFAPYFVSAQSGNCSSNTPFFQVNLAGNPNGTWTSNPAVSRNGTCCTNANNCIEFEINIDPSSVAINFAVASGALPTGAMYYQLNCGPTVAVGQSICITGSDPHIITFCKPGNNQNTYAITTYSNPSLDPTNYLSEGCPATLNAYGVDSGTVSWTDITGGGIYNSWLSCTNCTAPEFTSQIPSPSYIDYKVCAMPIAASCNNAPLWCDTIRIYIAPKITVSFPSNVSSYCANEAGILLSTNANGGAQPYSFIWTNSSGNVVGSSNTYYANTPGVYTIEVRDTLYSRCGSTSASANVVMDALPVVTMVPQSSIICKGSSVNITAAGGASYLWNTGENTQSILVSPPATSTYTVTVTSTNGCSASSNATVTVKPLPVANSGVDQTICQGLSALINATGGASYLWSTGASSSSITVTPFVTTTYTVTATSSNCTASDNMVININPLPVANAGVDQTICSGQNITINASGGTSYQWSTGSTNASITVTPASTTNYALTVTNASGCTARDNVAINVNSTPIADAGPDQTICEGQIATITASGGNSYLWSNGTGSSSIIVSPGTTSSYAVTVTGENGCTAIDDVLVYVNSAPNANAGADQSICIGQSLIITASGGSSYFWNTGATSSSINITPASTSTYIVTVISGNNCIATDAVSILGNPAPTANAGIDQTICAGNSATITASGGSSYSWNNGASSATINVAPLVNTLYTVTVTNSYGCSATDQVLITVNPIPVASAGQDQMVCQGNTAILTASGGASYTWNTGASSATITLSPNATTNYNVSVTASNGCSSSDEATVYVNSLPLANAGIDQTICLGQSITLSAGGGSGYQWNTGATTTSIQISPVSQTNYIVTVTSGNGCTASDNVSVTVNSLPAAYASADQIICLGQSTTLTASGGVAYVWNTGAETASIIVTPASTVNYIVTLSNSSGCTASDNVLVTVNSIPNGSAGPDQIICNGQPVLITASGGSSYNWNIGATSSVINVLPPSNTTYTVTVSLGGCTATDAVSIIVNELPIAFAGNDAIICQGQSSDLSASGGTSYQWNTGGHASTFTTTPSNTTTFTVTVTDNNGCSDSDDVIITVNNVPAAYAGVDQVICQGQPGTLTANGGTAYHWNTGASSPSITVSPAVSTTYSVTVTSANNCTGFDFAVVTVNPEPTADAGIDQTICQGNATTINASGGTAYLWNNGSTASFINVSPAFTTTYIVTVSNSFGCISTDNVMVYVNPLPLANAGADITACPYDNVTLTASGGSQYQWSTGAAMASINVNPSANHNYTVTVTHNGCQATDAVMVFVNPMALANAGADQIICPGQNTILSANTATTYLWGNGANTQTTTVSPAFSTTYTLTVTSGACVSTDDIVVNIANNLNADAGLDVTICAGDTVIMIASGGSTYSWDNGINSNINIVYPSISTTYTVITTSGACSASDDIVINVNNAPVANAGFDQTVCEGNIATLHGIGGLAYLWSNGSTAVNQIVCPPITTTFYLTVTNSDGCSATDDIIIAVNSLPIISAGADQTICSFQSATLTSTGGLSYLWNNGLNTASISVTPTVSTNYIVTATGSNGCTATDNVLVIINQNPVVSAGPDQSLCYGQSTTLSASLGDSYHWDNGATTASIIVAPTLNTQYKVTISNINGCTASDEVAVAVHNLPPVNVSSNQTICQGELVTLAASGGISYVWSNGITSVINTIAPAATAIYTVTATNIFGCTSSDDIVITVNAFPMADAGSDIHICMGQTASLSASGGDFYHWDTGDNGILINVSPTVTTGYVVTVTSANGCTASDMASVNVDALPISNAGNDQTICFGQSALLVVNAGSTYQWNNGANTAVISVSPATTQNYSVTVVDSNGCSASDETTVSVNSLPVPSAGLDQSVCFGESTTLTATGGTSYSWSSGSLNSTISVTPFATSNYTVTVSNINKCSATDEVTIYVNSLPNAFAGSDQIICYGHTASVNASGGSQYLWNNGSNAAATLFSPTITTSYYVTVTNSNGCSATDDIIIYLNPLPTVSAGSDQTICKGRSATLAASGGNSFIWNNGSNSASLNVAPVVSTTYSVIITNSSGCTASDEVVVFVNPLPIASAGSDQITCSGYTTLFSATGGIQYLWNTNDTSSSILVDPNITTTYSVTAINSFGCSATDEVLLIVNPLPNTYAGIDQTICLGQQTTLIASGGSSYQWNEGSYSSAINVQPLITTTYIVVAYNNGCTESDDVVISVSPAPLASAGNNDTICLGAAATLSASGGFYYQWNDGQNAPTINVSPLITTTYIVSVTGSNGCPATDKTVVYVNYLPVANSGPDRIICIGETLELNGSGGTNYIWSNGAQTASTSVIPSSNTIYTLTVTDANNCSSTDEISVITNSNPTANAGSDQIICYGHPATFVANGGTSYFWNTGNANASLTVIPLASTNFAVTVFNNAGCTASDNVFVTVNPTPIANAGIDQSICRSQSTIINASGGSSYLWNSGDTTSSIIVTPFTTTNYIVTVIANRCSSTDDITLTVNSPPAANAGPDKQICEGDSVSLTATGGSYYQWNTTANIPTTLVQPTINTTYTVTVTSNNGCIATDFTVVTVKPVAQASLNDTAICVGQTLLLTAQGGTSYFWSTGSSSSSISTTPGQNTTYAVTVTNNGCSSIDEVYVTVHPTPLVTVGLDESICMGETIFIVASGGIGYVWSNGDSSAAIIVSPSSTTTYSVTATDYNSCTGVDNIVVSVFTTPIANAGTDQVLCQGKTATLVAYGGVNYLWDNGATTSVTTVTPPYTTTYTVTVSIGSCSSSDQVVVYVNPIPVANAGPDISICRGDTAHLCGSGGTSYIWSNGNSSANISVQPAITTSYSITVSNNGCSATDQVAVNILTPEITVIPATPAICNGESIILTASGASNYIWTPSIGLSSATTASVTANPTATTVYTIIGSNDVCSGTQSVTLVVNRIPQIDVSETQIICEGSSCFLVASGAITYQWNTGSANDTVFVAPLLTTTFIVTATSNGCSATDYMLVIVNPAPNPNLGPDRTICFGTQVTLTAHDASIYQWSNGDIDASITVSPPQTMLYTVTATGANGCSQTDKILIMVNSSPQAEAGIDQTVCKGESATLAANGGDSYLWSTGDTGATITVSPSFTISYTVTVNGNNCTASDNVIITVAQKPILSVSANIKTGCPPLKVIFKNNSMPSGLICNWNFGDGNTVTASEPIHTYTQSGYYDVLLTAYDSNGCLSTIQYDNLINVFPATFAQFIAFPDVVQSIEPMVNFNDQSINAQFWQWNFGDTTSPQNHSNLQSPDHWFSEAGIYNIWLTTTNTFGCKDSISHSIEVILPITFYIPNCFTPSGDKMNDFFGPSGVGIDQEEYSMVIFNRWGGKVYETISIDTPWNGKMNGTSVECAMDVYVYKIHYKDIYGKSHRLIGSVTLLR